MLFFNDLIYSDPIFSNPGQKHFQQAFTTMKTPDLSKLRPADNVVKSRKVGLSKKHSKYRKKRKNDK